MKKTIAEVAAEYLRENGLNGVMLGDTWSIHEIAKRAGKNYEGHPSRTWKAIMAALDRILLFEKKYVRLDRLVRYYALKVPVNE